MRLELLKIIFFDSSSHNTTQICICPGICLSLIHIYYDWGWGNSMYTLNTWYTDEWQTTSDYYANETYYQTVQWNRYLIRDPYFLVLLQEKYQEARETILEEYVKDLSLIHI